MNSNRAVAPAKQYTRWNGKASDQEKMERFVAARNEFDN